MIKKKNSKILMEKHTMKEKITKMIEKQTMMENHTIMMEKDTH